jgi:glucose-6-phosphate-specific signal transduction histidine kinase
MSSAFLDRLEGRRRGPLVFLLCLALAIAIGAADLASGYEISFSLFYLGPVCLVAWHLGWGAGAALAIVSAVVWSVADQASGHVYSHPSVLVWNSGVRLGFFLQGAYLVARVRGQLLV